MDDRHSQLHRTQKIGFALLSCFAVCVLLLGVYQFRTTIYGPFALSPVSEDTTDLTAINQLFDDEQTRLQRIDTDGDGLNDYEELNFYNTSPYIADTDSDGIDDALEIANGSDPICPSGADCELYNPSEDNNAVDATVGVSSLLTDSVDTSDTLLDAIAGAAAVTESVNTNGTPNASATSTATFTTLDPEAQATIAALLTDPEAIRALLRQSGSLSEEQIASFSDDVLLQTAIELLNQ